MLLNDIKVEWKKFNIHDNPSVNKPRIVQPKVLLVADAEAGSIKHDSMPGRTIVLRPSFTFLFAQSKSAKGFLRARDATKDGTNDQQVLRFLCEDIGKMDLPGKEYSRKVVQW